MADDVRERLAEARKAQIEKDIEIMHAVFVEWSYDTAPDHIEQALRAQDPKQAER